MMLRLLVGLVIGVYALNAAPGNVKYASYAFGKRYDVEVTDTDLNRAPKWEDAAENPPVSARQAITIATEFKKTLVQDEAGHEWVLTRASLTPSDEGQWHWLVEFEARIRNGGSTGRPPNLRLAVLMDGTAVKPVVSDHP